MLIDTYIYIYTLILMCALIMHLMAN
jgi:hypothetical protein